MLSTKICTRYDQTRREQRARTVDLKNRHAKEAQRNEGILGGGERIFTFKETSDFNNSFYFQIKIIIFCFSSIISGGFNRQRKRSTVFH